MCQSAENSVEHIVEMFADVLSEESQHDVAIFLKQHVLAPVATIGLGISQMLASVNLNRDARFRIKKIHFHVSHPSKGIGNWTLRWNRPFVWGNVCSRR